MSKVWPITGSSRGLGRHQAEAALESGHRIIATARKPEQLANLELQYKSQVHRMALDDTGVFFNTEDLFRERGEAASLRFR
jgi:NADP-dependent 3-hydroxy acid dehydrogenase YdfG